MQINESIEDYLERIYMLSKVKKPVRAVQVARELGVTKASVSHAVKLLRNNGYLKDDTGLNLELTEAGEKIAVSMYERHYVIAKLLMELGVDEDTAYKDSCRIEHVLSEESFRAICDYADKMRDGEGDQ